jgi:hypothetical protein
MKADGIKVYGISYDTADSLKAFSDEFGITYPLLSDEDSAVIKQFGILNTLITPEDTETDATGKSFYGLPFPGVYVTDGTGVVSEKFFSRYFGTRSSTGSILNSALGKVLKHDESPYSAVDDERVKVSAFLADESMKLEYTSTLYLRFELAEGLHLYGNPLPDGFIPTEVEFLETPGIRFGDAVYPETHAMRFDALDVTLPVYEGVMDVAIPVTATSEILNWTNFSQPESVELKMRVRYQACSDTVCFLPKSTEISLKVPIGSHVMPKNAAAALGRSAPRK